MSEGEVGCRLSVISYQLSVFRFAPDLSLKSDGMFWSFEFDILNLFVLCFL